MEKLELTKKVKYILENYELARNSDVMLHILLINEYFPDSIVTFSEKEIFVKTATLYIVREDHIKRIRAIFNSKGLYLPTDEKVRKQRKISQERWENYLKSV